MSLPAPLTTDEAGRRPEPPDEPGATRRPMRHALGRLLTSPRFIVFVGFVVFVATRWFHPIRGLGNPDIAGILYSADLLNHGLLPYRDTVDMKPPGTFFLVAAVFRFAARDLDVLQIAYAFWLLSGAPAIGIAARVLYDRDPRRDVATAIAMALYLTTIGAFDMNYASWMAVAYAWSFAMLLVGLLRDRWYGHVLAGVFAVFAYLLKTQSLVLAPLFVLLFVWAKRRREPGARVLAFAYWTLGAAIGIAPLVLIYASHRSIPALLRGLFPVAFATEYSARRTLPLSDLNLIWRVPRQQVRHFPLLLTLAAAAIVGARRSKTHAPEIRESTLAPQLWFWIASLAGCALGGLRFFVHYLPQCVPALVLLAAHPASLRWLEEPRRTLVPKLTFLASRAHALFAAGLTAFLIGRIPFGLAASVDNRGTHMVELAGKMIHDNTTPDDRVLVWGWPAWGTYYFADRRSPSAIFKVLGKVTEFNDNSESSSATAIHFRDGPLARELLSDMLRDPPAYFVRARPFFPGSPTDPLDEFIELRDLIARDYIPVAGYGHIGVYERRGRIRKP